MDADDFTVYADSRGNIVVRCDDCRQKHNCGSAAYPSAISGFVERHLEVGCTWQK